MLSHAPAWRALALFFSLLALGAAQARPRAISRRTVAVVPGAMILLALGGLLSAFGASVVGILAWLAGLCVAALVRQFCVSGRGVTYSQITGSFYVRGSWRPLGLMMGIFATWIGADAALSRSPELAAAPLFVGGVGLLYGLLSGLFLARALLLWRLARYGGD